MRIGVDIVNPEEKRFLRRQVKLMPRKGTVVEIGSWKGGSAVELAKANKEYKKKASLYCIDTWDYQDGHNDPELCRRALSENIYKIFQRNMKRYPHKVLVGKNDSFLNYFADGSVVLLFLDADHSKEAVKQDIKNWLPKMAKGGILCGHDYGRKEYGVTEAVIEMLGKVENPARSMWKYNII